MKPYDQLTPAGIKRRLKKVAELALDSYDLSIEELDYLVEETNVFFKATGSQGKKYALKVFQEESSTIEDNLAEVFFLQEIAGRTSIAIPKVVPAKNGDPVVFVDSKYTPVVKRVAIYTWLEGEDLDGKESPEWFRELGRTAARLHEATQDLPIPRNLQPKKWDKVFNYNGETAVYHEKKYDHHLPKGFRNLMDQVIPYMDKKLLSYYDAAVPQLIHADLNPWNVRIFEKEMRLLDFEEAMLGLPVHDLAIALFYYRHDPAFIYEEVKAAIFEGYEEVRPLPAFTDFDLEFFMAARRVNFMNYVLLIEDDPKAYLEKRMARAQEFVEVFDVLL